MKKYWGESKKCIAHTHDEDIEDLEIPSADEFIFKEPKVIETVQNHIYFYSEIEREKILQLNKKIKDLDNENIGEKIFSGREKMDSIYIYINSFGGSIFSGFSGMDNILQCKSDVITIVDGICASAATFLSIVGKERYIMPHSFMLIHQISSGFWGKYSEAKDEIQNLDLFMKMIKDIYGKYTKIPMKKLDEIMDHDLFLNADACLKYGMVDKIMQ
jgi:ATP-dependent Clp endopeptidase proteolytic subunit ClpP